MHTLKAKINRPYPKEGHRRTDEHVGGLTLSELVRQINKSQETASSLTQAGPFSREMLGLHRLVSDCQPSYTKHNRLPWKHYEHYKYGGSTQKVQYSTGNPIHLSEGWTTFPT
jgi:hypothetical protein